MVVVCTEGTFRKAMKHEAENINKTEQVLFFFKLFYVFKGIQQHDKI